MRILIDNLVAQSCPALSAISRDGHQDIEIQTFDWSLEFPAIGQTFDNVRPDVIVLDPFVFVMAVRLLQTMNVHGYGNIARVVGTSKVTDLIKVKARYKGFHDVVDLSSSPDQVLDHVREINNGNYRLTRDRIWQSITKPNSRSDIRLAPSDSDDRDILDLVCIGLSDRDIATTIHMSHQTVRNRISKMLTRSGVTNRTQLAWLHQEEKRVDALLQRSNLQTTLYPSDH